MGGISNAFQEIANICDALEQINSGAAITTAKPYDEDILQADTFAIEVDVEIPLLQDSQVARTTEITLNEAEFTEEGRIRLTCLARTFSTDSATASSSLKTETRNRTAAEQDDEGRGERSSRGRERENEEGDSDDADERQVEEDVADTPADAEYEERLQSDETELPPYQDPDRLREVYEEHSTFAEMRDALGVDVTPQTVRRYMIKHNIHQPSPTTGSSSISTLLKADPDSFPVKTENRENQKSQDDTTTESARFQGSRSNDDDVQSDENEDKSELILSGDGGASVTPDGCDSEQASRSNDGDHAEFGIPDDLGIELPDGCTVANIRDIVLEANTLYDVEQEMELDRTEARDILQELNLLELVTGRLSSRNFQKKTADEINSRIQLAMQETGRQ